jgi:hypothetical protein
VVLLVIAVVFLYLLISLVVSAQDIKPPCAGIGDPQFMLCTGRGMVSHEEARAIRAAELVSDLLWWVALPSILGVSLLTLILRHRSRPRDAA